jgi:hypothetical protein
LPLFLQKESGVWGEAPINKHPEKGKKAFCTICTDERLKKVNKNFHISARSAENTQVQRTTVLCRVWDRVPQNDSTIALQLPCNA